MLRRLELVSELHRAVAGGELVVHYQPVVDLRRDALVGVEALVRWQHPQRGLLLPSEFVPLAEETGLIGDLGRVVLERACAEVASWTGDAPAAASLWVSVNLSARQFHAPRLVEEVRAALRQAGLPPERLQLEITENAMMDDAETTLRLLAELRELGVRLAIDDFGTGYSSLNYLQRFGVDVLKMDRSFVRGMDEGREHVALARAVVTLAHAFDLAVTAEGIETAAQLRTLRELGCHYGQGYLFSAPVPGEALRALLRAGRRWLPA